MSESLNLRWAQLRQLYSIVLCINEDARIVSASDCAQRHIPTLKARPGFFDTFTLLRPAGARDFAALREHLASLFLLKTRDESFAIRGQFIEVDDEGDTLLCFCGAPWLFWMSANRPEVKLGMGDFSPQDSQLDQLFLMNTEQRMVSDLEKLNSDLKVAKQETEQAQAQRNALFARMSHEMRTPLNGVVSALSLLSDEKLPATAQQLLQLAESSSRNLLHVINYILDISKIEAGESSIEQVLFDLPRLLKSVTDIVRARAVEKGLDLQWHCSEPLGSMYLGDKGKLRQCLLNLVTNAIKFTAAGGISVRALPGRRGDDAVVRFEVEDTGPGISAEDQAKIFEPFWTGSHDDKHVDTGTGLGLDIVRRNVALLDGELGMHSEPGKGSLFWIEVPLEAQPELGSEHEPAPARVVPEQFSGRVLLVDDNSTNLLLGRMILESLGVTVEEAEDGASAVDKALRGTFDLVLMDISMPTLDGVAATEQIRARVSAEVLPIVALTAYASTEEKERCLGAGMNDYLTKPIVRDRLAEQLDHWLDRQRGDRATGAAEEAGDHRPTEQPALAMEVLDTLREQIGNDNLATVLEHFAQEVRTRWQSLQDALEQGEAEAMTREAHTLASTCRSVGLVNAGETFSMLEEQLRNTGSLPGAGLGPAGAALDRGLNALAEFRQSAA